MNNIKKFYKINFKFLLIIFFIFTISSTFFKNNEVLATNKNKNQKISITVDNIKRGKTTTFDFIYDLIKKNKTDKEIVKEYFNLPHPEIAAMISNNRLYRHDMDRKFTEQLTSRQMNLETVNRIQKVRNLIKDEEEEYIKKYIKLPKKINKNKPIVIVNPGFGFDEPGATTRDQNGEYIEGKDLNANMAAKLVRKLLKKGFEVYLVYDLKDYGINLPKKNDSLHILFEGRPPIEGAGYKCRMADASAFGIKEIIKKIKKKYENAKIASVCIHHNASSNKNATGFISFYRTGKITSEKFEKNSKKLAKKCLKNCKNIFNNKSFLQTDLWVVCGFGSMNEKTEKKFNDEAAIFLELGFMSNPTELKKILKPSLQNKMATSIANSLHDYFLEKNVKEFSKILLKNYKNTVKNDKSADVLSKLNFVDNYSTFKENLDKSSEKDLLNLLNKSLDEYFENK